MIKIFLHFIIFVLSTGYAIANPNDVRSRCKSIGTEDKYVVQLSGNMISAKVCTLSSYHEEGDACSGYGIWEQAGWLEITDLNGDKKPDLILSFFSGGLWTGSAAFMVLVNCGDDSYIKVLDDGFATLKSSRKKT
jgi:hypothetical protein